MMRSTISSTRSSLREKNAYRLMGRALSSAATRRTETASRPSASASPIAVVRIASRLSRSTFGTTGRIHTGPACEARLARRLAVGESAGRDSPAPGSNSADIITRYSLSAL